MNTKKIMAVMVVLMMAASSIALLQFADEPVADQNDTMPGVSDLKVGETLGFKVSEQMNMTEALSKAAPAIKELLDEMASSMGTTTKDLIDILAMYLPEDSVKLLKSIVNNPESVTITKKDLLNLVNNMGLGITIKDIDFSVNYEMISATKKIAEHEYRNISTTNITVNLTLDITSNTQYIPSITIKNAKLNMRSIEETTMKMAMTSCEIATKGEVDISFTGTSNFIDDSAASIDKLINFNMGSEKKFNIPLNIKESVNYKIYVDNGFVLPTVPGSPVTTNTNFSINIEAEATSSVKAIQDIFTPSKVSDKATYKLPSSVEYYAATEEAAEHYITSFYQYVEEEGSDLPVKTQVGSVYSSADMFGIKLDMQSMSLILMYDLKEKSIYMQMNTSVPEVQEEIYEEIGDDVYIGGSSPVDMPASITLMFNDEAWIVIVDSTTIDLTPLKEEMEKADLRYGEKYILTSTEIDKFENDVSKTAYALDYDIKGFTGKDLNVNVEPEKKCPISANMMIIITMVIAFLVVIATLAISSRKNKP